MQKKNWTVLGGLLMLLWMTNCAGPSGNYCDLARDITLNDADKTIAQTMSRPARESLVFHRKMYRQKCL